MIGAAFKEQMREYYRQHFESTKCLQPNWLWGVRERAFHSFYTQDFPTQKSEAWKYTSLARFDDLLVPPFKKEPAPHLMRGGLGGIYKGGGKRLQKKLIESPYSFLFVNGKWTEASEEAIPGVCVVPLSSAWSFNKVRDSVSLDGTLFTALNTSFLEEGCFISVSSGVVIEAPLVFVFVADSISPFLAFPRVIIEAGAGSHLTVIEHFVSLNGSFAFTNSVAQIYLENRASLNYYKLQAGDHLISNTRVQQKADSCFLSFFNSSVTSFVRNDLQVLLQESGASASLFGLYSVAHQEHVDNHVEIEHKSNGTKSRTLYHGILDDEARGVFNGKISVGEHLHGVDAALNNHNLLLSGAAEMDTKPELEIYSDDVKCSHGATVGALDEEALFYLRSRGMACDLAMEILKRAFMERVFTRIPDKRVVTYLRDGEV